MTQIQKIDRVCTPLVGTATRFASSLQRESCDSAAIANLMINLPPTTSCAPTALPSGIDQLASLISTVHRSLSGLGKSAPAPAPLVPAVSIRRSVQRDCRLPRVRVSQPDAPPAYPRRSRARTRGVSRPVEVAS